VDQLDMRALRVGGRIALGGADPRAGVLDTQQAIRTVRTQTNPVDSKARR